MFDRQRSTSTWETTVGCLTTGSNSQPWHSPEVAAIPLLTWFQASWNREKKNIDHVGFPCALLGEESAESRSWEAGGWRRARLMMVKKVGVALVPNLTLRAGCYSGSGNPGTAMFSHAGGDATLYVMGGVAGGKEILNQVCAHAFLSRNAPDLESAPQNSRFGLRASGISPRCPCQLDILAQRFHADA